MDINGMSEEGFGMYGAAAFPYGMGTAVALNDRILKEKHGGDSLTETEREHIIMECKDARSDKERQKIIDEKVPDGNPYALFERDEID